MSPVSLREQLGRLILFLVEAEIPALLGMGAQETLDGKLGFTAKVPASREIGRGSRASNAARSALRHDCRRA